MSPARAPIVPMICRRKSERTASADARRYCRRSRPARPLEPLGSELEITQRTRATTWRGCAGTRPAEPRPCVQAATRTRFGIEEVGLVAELLEIASDPLPEAVEEPFVDRHAEALLRPVDQLVRDHAADRLLEDVLERSVLRLRRRSGCSSRARRTCGRGTARGPRGSTPMLILSTRISSSSGSRRLRSR